MRRSYGRRSGGAMGGWDYDSAPSHTEPALLACEQFALLLFGQPDVGNVCTML